MRCYDIINLMEKWAPKEFCEHWDNSGLLIGDYEGVIKNVLISLDFTDKVLEEAVNLDCQLVVTHHPPIFRKIGAVNSQTPVGKLILKTAKKGIAVYSAHTNLDYAQGGTNDILFERLRLMNKKNFMPANQYGMSLGRIGELAVPMTLAEFAGFIRKALCLSEIRYVGNGESIVKTVALCTGSGGGSEYFEQAVKESADVYVTGDIRYHDGLDAVAMGLNIIDATHYATEVIVCDKIKKYLYTNINTDIQKINIYISKVSNQPFHTCS